MNELHQVNSYFGLLRQSPASHHLRARLANAARDRGFCVNSSFTKVFRGGATGKRDDGSRNAC
jgi:RNA-directed DNA polymerase